MSDHGPDAVIIGAMKCATTTLHNYLARHAQVVTGKRKELDFFSHDEVWGRGLDWYQQQFPSSDTDAIRLDSSPNYSKRQHWPFAAERLAATNPRAKLIYLIREPVSRAKSAYVHELAAGREHRSVDAAFSDNTNPITQTSRYAWQLEPFLERFSREQLLVLRFDQMVSVPDTAVARALRHLGVAEAAISTEEPVAINASASKTMPTWLARRVPSTKARSVLRHLIPRVADRPIPDITIPDGLALSMRRYLLDDLRQLQASGFVDVSDWIAEAED